MRWILSAALHINLGPKSKVRSMLTGLRSPPFLPQHQHMQTRTNIMETSPQQESQHSIMNILYGRTGLGHCSFDGLAQVNFKQNFLFQLPIGTVVSEVGPHGEKETS